MHELERKNINGIERLVSAVGGGALLSAAFGRSWLGGVLLGAGGRALLARATTGHSRVYDRFGMATTREAWERGIHVTRCVTINKSAEEVYEVLRHFRAMPRILDQLAGMEALSDGGYTWRIKEGPLTLECTTDLISDKPGQMLAWRTREGSQLRCDGEVTLKAAPGNRGTELRLEVVIAPPGGRAVMALRPLLRKVARHQLARELYRVRQLIETGEITSSAMRSEHAALETRHGDPSHGIPRLNPEVAP